MKIMDLKINSEQENLAARALHAELQRVRINIVKINDLPVGMEKWADMVIVRMLISVEGRIKDWEKQN